MEKNSLLFFTDILPTRLFAASIAEIFPTLLTVRKQEFYTLVPKHY